MMIENKIDQSSIPYIDLKVGRPEYNIQGRVKRGLTKKQFGYGIMERKVDGNYDVTFKGYVPETQQMETIDFALEIPAGVLSPSVQPSSRGSKSGKGKGKGTNGMAIKKNGKASKKNGKASKLPHLF